MKVGERLAEEGVIGRFALDFVAVRTGGGWDPYAIELNLRKGGTTHPFLTLQFLTDGVYDPETGVVQRAERPQKYFVATDHVESRRSTGADAATTSSTSSSATGSTSTSRARPASSST